MSLLTLGSVTFQAFEVPARISFGGAQSLRVHKLIGGARVIDSLGRDDAALVWSGVLSGASATARGRALDAMRAAGEAQTLTWDAYCYAVVIAKLTMDFCNPWWIPYRMTCEVQADLGQGLASAVDVIGTDILADLTAAASFLDPATSLAIEGDASLYSGGMSGQKQALVALTATQQQLQGRIQVSGAGLGAADLADVVSAAGTLANLCCARGYLERSLSNIEQAGP
jgi:hypothetical protein